MLNANKDKEGTCASCSEQLPSGTVAYICDACALEFENEFKEVSTNDEFGDSYDEPKEEPADTESELHDLKIEEWAEDDEVLKQDLESEESEDLQRQLENALWRKSVGIKDGASDELENKESIATRQEE